MWDFSTASGCPAELVGGIVKGLQEGAGLGELRGAAAGAYLWETHVEGEAHERRRG